MERIWPSSASFSPPELRRSIWLIKFRCEVCDAVYYDVFVCRTAYIPGEVYKCPRCGNFLALKMGDSPLPAANRRHSHFTARNLLSRGLANGNGSFEDGISPIYGDNKLLLALNKFVDGGTDGRSPDHLPSTYQLFPVFCNFCYTVLISRRDFAVSASDPRSRFTTVEVRCRHCTELLPVNIPYLFHHAEIPFFIDLVDGISPIYGDNKMLLDLNEFVDGGTDGRRIGKLVLFNTEIGKGSNGTIVLEGLYGGREVAVKRLVRTHHDVALQEIRNLIASDRHPNIVRYYGVEYDQDFVYLALERCTCSLGDLVQMCSDTSQNPEHKNRLDSVKGIMKDVNLWKPKGRPSPLCLKLMRDVVSGLADLHDLGIIHRDLKPQNVLIIEEKTLCAKLCDMGISRRLAGDMSSLGPHATVCGTPGWQAPEQLIHGRQTPAIDLFSLGCVLFFFITGGRHPYGNHLERDINVVNNQVNLFPVEHIPEAVHLISRLLKPEPELRPNASEVLRHPLFWSSEMRLSFLRDASDWVELEARKADSDILEALESIATVALCGKWDEKIERAFIRNLKRYRQYKFDSVQDLLRAVRNTFNHYYPPPKKIKERVGPEREDLDGYFANRFPRFFIEVYKVVYEHCREEEFFHKYFKSDAV